MGRPTLYIISIMAGLAVACSSGGGGGGGGRADGPAAASDEDDGEAGGDADDDEGEGEDGASSGSGAAMGTDDEESVAESGVDAATNSQSREDAGEGAGSDGQSSAVDAGMGQDARVPEQEPPDGEGGSSVDEALACQRGLLSPTAEDSPECQGLAACTEEKCIPQLAACFDAQDSEAAGACQRYTNCLDQDDELCSTKCAPDATCLNCFVHRLNDCYATDCEAEYVQCIGMFFPDEIADGPTCAEIAPCCAALTDPNVKAMCEAVVMAGLDVACAGAAPVVCPL